MTWSTREVAELAGTTVNTVRHYHRLGILDEPERRYNGYKQYRVRHLVSLIHVRRMVDLGLPLARVAFIDPSAPGTLRELDAELRASVNRLNRARADVAALLRAGAPLDSPPGFEPVAAQLTQPDRSLVHICTRLYSTDQIASLSRMIEQEPLALRIAFIAMPHDADEMTRHRLARQIAESGANWRAVDGPDRVGQTLADALRELYNPAQQEVIRRASRLLAGYPAFP